MSEVNFKVGDVVTVKHYCTGCQPGTKYVLHYRRGELYAKIENPLYPDQTSGCSCQFNWIIESKINWKERITRVTPDERFDNSKKSETKHL